MNLVWFLTIGALFSLLLGEFGRFPFGTPGAVSVNDVLLIFVIGFLYIWQIGIQKKILFDRTFLILISFWFVAFISLVFSQNFQGFLYLIRFIIYSSTYWIGFMLIKDKQVTIEKLFSIFITIGLLFLIIGFFQLIFFPDLEPLEQYGFDPHQGRLTATFLDPNFAGGFLSIPLLLSLTLWKIKKKRKYLLVSFGFLISIFLTFSRSSWLMAGVELLIWGFFYSKKILFITIVLVVVLFFAVPRFEQRVLSITTIDQTAALRIASWHRGLQIFEQSPLLGIGFNNLQSYFSVHPQLMETQSSISSHSIEGIDSSFIFILATAGVLGFLTYLAFFISLFEKIFKGKEKIYQVTFLSIVLGLFVHSQFVNSLFYPPIMEFSFLLAGALGAREVH